MRSFTLSLIATLFFGAVSSAVPLLQSGHPVGAIARGTGTNPVDDATNLIALAVDNILNLRAAPRGIASIITEAQSKLTPLTAQIGQLLLQRFLNAVY